MTDIETKSAKMRGMLRRLSKVDGFCLALGGFVSRRGTHLVLTELCGLRTELLRGVVMNPGIGLGGRVLTVRRPVVVEDYVSSAIITHQMDRAVIADGVRGALALPIVVGKEIRAVIYGGSRTQDSIGTRTADAAIRIVQAFADDLAVDEEVERRVARACQEYEPHLTPAKRQLDTSGTADPTDVTAELLAIAAEISDARIRERLLRLCGRLPTHTPAAHRPQVNLSRRETDVLIQLAAGFTNAEIAERLAILPTTVKTHLSGVMRKLGTRNRVETLAAARRAGLLS